MRVLALCSFPREAAATRFRVEQFVEPLARRGIELTVSPFLSSEQFASIYRGGGIANKAVAMIAPITKRVRGIPAAGSYDIMFVQREAMLFGPAIFEWLYARFGRLPMVLDLDDATYVQYISPTYGRLGSFFKFFGKTDKLIRHASVVTCGNRFIAEYVKSKGSQAVVVPTVVDLDEFRPAETTKKLRREDERLVLGWIGTHSTFPFLESLFPVFERLAKTHRFVLKIVGANTDTTNLKKIEVENLQWSLDREVKDFRSLDIGLYPITVSSSANSEWIKGKSGFKAIQYMAVGVPFVMSPVGVCAELGVPGVTHFNADSELDWYNSLNTLLSDESLRARMGAAGREHALENYKVEKQVDLLASTFENLMASRKVTAE